MQENLEEQLLRANERIEILERMIEDSTRDLYLEQEHLMITNTFLNEILNNMDSLVLVVDYEGVIKRVNSTTLNSLGYKKEELVGKNYTMIIHDNNLNNIDLGSLSSTLKMETIFKTSAGGKIPVIFSASKLSESELDMNCFVLVAHDITEKKNLEAQVLQSQKLEAIGQLASGIAHEINTPIQFVGDNTNFIRDSLDAIFSLINKVTDDLSNKDYNKITEDFKDSDINYFKDEIPRALEQTLEGVKRVATIVRALKEFAHPGTTTKQMVDLNQLINSTIIVSTNEWKYVADIDFIKNKNLPLVPALPGELNQVLLNLIINSCHAIADKLKSGQKGNIKVWAELENENAVIFIKDSGGGIPKSISEKVFDPFFTTKEVGKGTGQGLSMARSIIVDKHSGKISFEAEEGVGTTFKIELPLK